MNRLLQRPSTSSPVDLPHAPLVAEPLATVRADRTDARSGRQGHRLLRSVLLCAFTCALAWGCASEKEDPVTSSQTHWLEKCESSSECGDLSCECGVCTVTCSDNDACGSLSSNAVCAATEGVTACGSGAAAEVCLDGCENDDDCGTNTTCNDDGACVPNSPATPDDDAVTDDSVTDDSVTDDPVTDEPTDSGTPPDTGTDDDEPPGDPSTPPGVRCADYEACDALSPCESGTNCIAFAECGSGLCIDGEAACELSCPDPSDCALAESYPEQLFCEGKVDAIPAEDTPTMGVQCGEYDACEPDASCGDGELCLSLSECGTDPTSLWSGAICIDQEEACELTCPDGGCLILESYPVQIACDGEQVPATPADGGATTPSGVQCGEYPACEEGCSDGAECFQISGCEASGAICIDPEVACALSCAAPETCVSLDSNPAQLDCEGMVPGTPASSGNACDLIGCPNGQVLDLMTCACVDESPTTPPGVDCTAYPSCSVMDNTCEADTDCIAIDGCDTAICIAADEACGLSCPEDAEEPSPCAVLESFPLQISCPGLVPGSSGDMPTSDGVDLDQLNSECVEDKCPAGLTPVHYFGIAGPQGPEFCSCSIPCAEDSEVCPDGSSCVTIADGPGEVCSVD